MVNKKQVIGGPLEIGGRVLSFVAGHSRRVTLCS